MKLSATSIAIAKMLLPYDSFDEIGLAFHAGLFAGRWSVYLNYGFIEFNDGVGLNFYATRGMNVSATTDKMQCTSTFPSVRDLLLHYGELP